MDTVPQIRAKRQTRCNEPNLTEETTTRLAELEPTFPKFKELPIEIRLDIWKRVLNNENCRLIFVEMHSGDYTRLPAPSLFESVPRTRWISRIAAPELPPTLRTCKESRIEGLKTYRLSLMEGERPTRIDPARDVVVVEESLPRSGLFSPDASLFSKLKHDLEPHGYSCQDIRHIGVHLSWASIHLSKYITRMTLATDLDESFCEFSNLESLTLVDESTMDYASESPLRPCRPRGAIVQPGHWERLLSEAGTHFWCEVLSQELETYWMKWKPAKVRLIRRAQHSGRKKSL